MLFLLVLLDSLTQQIWLYFKPPKPSFYEFPVLKYWQKPNSAQTGGGHFEMYFLNDEARVGNSGSFDKLFSMIIGACTFFFQFLRVIPP